MDDVIEKQEFKNKFGNSEPLDNFKTECGKKLNNDCSEVKQESEDSSMNFDTYENSKQVVNVWIKDEVTTVMQEFGTSGRLDNLKSECIEKLNNYCSEVKQEPVDSNTDCDTYGDPEQIVNVWIKDEVTTVMQEFGTSGAVDNFKSECIEELNNDCRKIKQEPVDSSTEYDTYEDSEQVMILSTKGKVEIADNGLNYSEEGCYSGCEAESSKEIITGSNTQESLKACKSLPHSSKRTESKNDSMLTLNISPNSAKQYNCTICDKPFVNKKYFNLHVQCHSGSDMFKCINCDKKYLTASFLKTHLLTHSNKKSHKCELCSKEFKMSSTLKKHLLSIHSDKRPHKCELCSKEFKMSSNLKKHLLSIHSDKKPYKCELCSKEFKMSGTLQSHLLTIHSDKKPHKCELCSKEFKLPSNLKRHLLTHSDEKPHKCELCSKEFNQASYLKSHLLTIHSNKKPHKCELCSKKFNRLSILKTHLLIHSDKKPHKCELCSKKFKLPDYLKIHLLMHSDKKPHKCKLCSKEFNQCSTLKKHMLMHSRLKPQV